MEKRRRLESTDGVSHLPQPIIQHIQSLLDRKQAAQTALLSKSWYNAWLTRSRLHFDDQHFRERGFDEFLNFVKRTIDRYDELNLKIESLKLWISLFLYSSVLRNWADEVFRKTMEMGVEDLDILGPSQDFVLPLDVLRTETLVRLSLRLMKINLPPDANVSCRKVKSLCLDYIGGDDFLSRLLPCFVNLENLTLRSIYQFTLKWPVSCPSVKSLSVTGMDMGIQHGLFSCTFPSVVDLVFASCSRLAAVGEERFSRSFPCVENLTVDSCEDTGGLTLSSNSLKYVTLVQVNNSALRFDVPNIRKFKLSGDYYPSNLPMMSITTDSREWESDISVHFKGLCSSDLWCFQLRRFLRKLSMSKVSLSVKFNLKCCYSNIHQLKGKPGPVVESLILLNPLPYSALPYILNGLLWSCRPKVVTQSLVFTSCDIHYVGGRASNECIKSLCKGLIADYINCSAEDESSCDDLDVGK